MAFDPGQLLPRRPRRSWLARLLSRDAEAGCWSGSFDQRHPLNVPGPFYAAETDTCCCGTVEAPHSILHDEDGMEFVCQQPRTLDQVEAIVRAAQADPFCGYGRDGDEQWTPELVRQWWHALPARMGDIERVLAALDVTDDPVADAAVAASRRAWRRYWESPQLELDLRRYVFRLHNRRYPEGAEPLPDL